MSQIDGKIEKIPKNGNILKNGKILKSGKSVKTEKSGKTGKSGKLIIKTNQNRKKHCELTEKFTREWKFPISTLQRNIN